MLNDAVPASAGHGAVASSRSCSKKGRLTASLLSAGKPPEDMLGTDGVKAQCRQGDVPAPKAGGRAARPGRRLGDICSRRWAKLRISRRKVGIERQFAQAIANVLCLPGCFGEAQRREQDEQQVGGGTFPGQRKTAGLAL